MNRRLIVNADDFGQSPGVNRGIIRAHRDGIVTSTSLMVRWPAAMEAVALGRTCPALSIGLHLDLGEWFYRDGDWPAYYQVVTLDDRAAVEAELDRQLAEFRRLVGHEPSHLDSHQNVHLREPVRSVVEACARQLGVPVRRCDARVQFCGKFYGQDYDGTPLPGHISVEGLLTTLAELPPGVTELACHPSAADDLPATMYRAERQQELRVLCDPHIRQAIERAGIELCSVQDAGR